MAKKCLECGAKISGREDKKYCSDHCRNTYNNKKNKVNRNLVRNTNNRLSRNYRILNDLNKKGKTKVNRSKLLGENFDFNLFTSIYTTKNGNTYYYVYDQGYLILEDDWFLLIKRN